MLFVLVSVNNITQKVIAVFLLIFFTTSQE